jgi:hypothetical protein
MLSTLKPLLRQIALWFAYDGRHFQIVSQVLFLSFGICYLSWDAQALHYLAAISGALVIQALGIFLLH